MNHGMRFLGLSTSDARAFADSQAANVATVTNVLGEIQGGTTPSDDEITSAIQASSALNAALDQFIGADEPGAYAAVTSDAKAQLAAAKSTLFYQQQANAAHGSTGFIPPLDASLVNPGIAGWRAFLADINGGLQTQAAQIDQAISGSSAAASAGAAAQAAAAAAANGGSPTGSSGGSTTPASGSSGGSSSTSTSTSGSTVVTPPSTAPPVVPPGVSPSTTVHAPGSPAALVAGITPAAWVFIGLGGLLVLGLWSGYVDVPKPVASALGMKSASTRRKKNPRRRTRRRRAR